MSTKLLLPRSGTDGQGIQPSQARNAALLAALAAVLLSASTDRLAASARPAQVSASASFAAEPDVSFVLPAQRPALHAHIDALVAALARKYRVSTDATKDVVDAAYAEAGRNGLDPLLVIAVIAVESRFNPIAQSDGGALGLMQVIPRYHADKFDAAGGESMLDPRVNIQVGVAVLKEYIRRGGTEIAGLQLYNGAIEDETSAYAHKVLAEKQRLQSLVRRGA
jgi:soluble lytic murein transglycosylase-like protein